jgi:hypothetical protein
MARGDNQQNPSGESHLFQVSDAAPRVELHAGSRTGSAGTGTTGPRQGHRPDACSSTPTSSTGASRDAVARTGTPGRGRPGQAASRPYDPPVASESTPRGVIGGQNTGLGAQLGVAIAGRSREGHVDLGVTGLPKTYELVCVPKRGRIATRPSPHLPYATHYNLFSQLLGQEDEDPGQLLVERRRPVGWQSPPSYEACRSIQCCMVKTDP